MGYTNFRSINNTIHSSTGFTPYRILFGHEIIANGEEHRVDPITTDGVEAERLQQKLNVDQHIQTIVSKNLEKAHEKSTRAYHLRFRKPAPIYQVGQKVYKRNFTPSSAGDSYNAKLGPAYTLCTVVSRRGTSSYELLDETGKNIGIFSSADLKPGVPEDT